MTRLIIILARIWQCADCGFVTNVPMGTCPKCGGRMEESE